MDKASITLGTLAANTGIISDGPAMTRGGGIISSTFLGGLRGHTEGEGPVIWGLVRGDLTLAELEEFLELEGPGSPADIVGSERASRGRFIRLMGTLGPGVAECGVDLRNTKMSGFRWAEGDEEGGWATFVYNLGAALTTGSFFEVLAKHFVRWNTA